ncbi:MAG TPA: chloride channel protein [Gemmatimonadaceae bacterium]|nr:chloride channel protein [Gemmatimonadaceae bacterium]
MAFFLWSLDVVTATRIAHPALLVILPIAGGVAGALQARFAGAADRGTHLILDEIDVPRAGVPVRLAPMVLLGTLVTHLFGGSAGREGTAVQMGGALAHVFDRLGLQRVPGGARISQAQRAMLLQAGVAAGFGSVFGTPFAGALFALEVTRRRRVTSLALLSCLLSALLAHVVVMQFGVQHTPYPRIAAPPLDGITVTAVFTFQVAIAAMASGIVAMLFARSTRGLAHLLRRRIRHPWMRPAIGGTIVVLLVLLTGTRDYLGLGVTSSDAGTVTILSSFVEEGARPFSWAMKWLFTTITVASGFKGGEVTPLFFIGAALGNAVATLLHAPVMLLAALCMVATLAGATRTPIACAVLGCELFGVSAAPWFVVACLLARACAGGTSIYDEPGQHDDDGIAATSTGRLANQ